MNNFKTHFWEVGKISLPLTLATASGTLLIFIDSLFATRVSIDTYEAIFLTLPIMGLSTGLGIGLAAAIADLISKQKELEQIKRLISASFILALACILAFLYVALIQSDFIERVAGIHKLEADSIIVSEFRSYWKVILWTFPMQIFFSVMIQFLTILKKQKAGSFIIFIILILNVILDYVLTQIFPWGAEGLAYSTMGVFSAGVFISCLFVRNETYFRWPYPSVFDRRFLQAFLQLSVTTLMIFMSIGIYSVSAILLNHIALNISTSALVVFAVYTQIMRVIIITGRGLMGGYIIYFGNALRDKKTEDYFPVYWAATTWIGLINVVGAILLYFLPVKLISLFDNVDPALHSDITYFLTIGSLIMFIFILPRIAIIAFISINKSIFMVLHSVMFVLLQLCLAYYWSRTGDVKGLAHAELATAIITSILVMPIFFYFLNQLRKQDAVGIST